VPSGVYSQIAATNLLMNKSSGVVTLLNGSSQVLFKADYVGLFSATAADDYGHLTADYQSLVLSPPFQGVFLPYQRVVAKEGGGDTNGLSNPGYDPTGNPIAIGKRRRSPMPTPRPPTHIPCCRRSTCSAMI